jgi:hypothetical protein
MPYLTSLAAGRPKKSKAGKGSDWYYKLKEVKMSLLSSKRIFPAFFRALIALVMLTLCAPVKKPKSSWVKGN